MTTLTLTLDHPHLETLPVVVPAAQEAQERARKAAAGWRWQYRVALGDGRVQLTFTRRKASAAEREA